MERMIAQAKKEVIESVNEVHRITSNRQLLGYKMAMKGQLEKLINRRVRREVELAMRVLGVPEDV